MSKSKIYTRTGDQGKTKLVDGTTVDKFSPRVEAYGTIDELNSHLGLFQNYFENSLVNFEDSNMQVLSAHGTDDCEGTKKSFGGLLLVFEQIQSDLFNIGSLLATEKQDVFVKLPQLNEKHVFMLEKQIDALDAELRPLQNFILPGGHITSAQLHVCRTVCRRAERLVTQLIANEKIQDPQHPYSHCLVYLNRLSDLLFVAARWFNNKFEISDVLWKPRNN
jgi:cob(I)alamin adenosyltransferase